LRFTEEFRDAAIACESNPAIRLVILTAAGPVFSFGGDLNEFMRHRSDIRTHIRQMTAHFHHAILILNRMSAPVIAAVNGMAAGGGFSLVCMSDLAIAKRSATFNFAYTRSGLTPDGGSTYFLTRLVGPQKAFDLMATNPTLTAAEAQSLGIIARVVDDDDFDAELERITKRLLALPSDALSRLKRLLKYSLNSSLEEQFEREAQSISEVAATPATLAALDAFLQR
jgi:2-(1,2-epoxy-1,2-dihydrophenyl)acetyl-CoA isomerase